jgi:hypothetical protein
MPSVAEIIKAKPNNPYPSILIIKFKSAHTAWVLLLGIRMKYSGQKQKVFVSEDAIGIMKAKPNTPALLISILE